MWKHKKKTLAGLGLALVIALVAVAGVSPGIYSVKTSQTGVRMHVGNGGNSAVGEIQVNATGNIDVESGASIVIKSGGELEINSGGILDVNGTFTAETLSASTLVADGASISGLVAGNSMALSNGASIDGTLAGDTFTFTLASGNSLALSNGASVTGTVAATTFNPTVGSLPKVMKIDTTLVQIDAATTVVGSTLVFTIPDTGGSIHVICGGTINTDDQGTKAIDIIGGTTVITTMTIAQTDKGDYFYEAEFTGTASGASVKALSRVTSGTETAPLVDYAKTDLDLSAVTTWGVRMTLAHADDEMSLEYCSWTYKPTP